MKISKDFILRSKMEWNKMKTNQLKAGSIISYLQMALGVAVGLLYTPIMINYLGNSEYGLYNTVVSVISMLSILSLGFNSSYIRYYSLYKKKSDNVGINRLNGLFLIVFLIIGIIAFLCGTYLSFHLDIVFKQGLTVKEYEIARTLMLLLTVNIAVSFPMSVFSNIISAHERFIFLKLLGAINIIVGPLVTLPLLVIGYRSIAMVTVSLCVSILVDIIYICYSFGILHIKFYFRNIEKGLFKSILTFTSFIAINIIIDQINLNIDKLLLARFKGTVAVAVYSVGYTLYNYYMMFSSSISGVFTPRIYRIVNSTENDRGEQKKQLTELFIRVGRLQFLLLGLICTGMIFFGQAFIWFWVGEGYETSYYVLILLAIPGTVPLIQNIGIEIQRAENQHKFRSIIYAVMAIINLILSIFLCQIYGPVGSAIGTSVSFVVANGFIMNIYYHKKCNIDILLFWKSIARAATGLLIPVMLGIFILIFLSYSNILVLTATIAAYSAVYILSIWFISMNDYEKGLLIRPLNKILRRG